MLDMVGYPVPGAVKGSRKESNDVLRLTLKINEYLKTQNCEVKLSRISDTNVSIDARTKEANIWNADYFLSIHRNSSPSSVASGDEIWIYSKAADSTYTKALNILNAVNKVTGLANRGVKKGATSYKDYAVNRDTKMHASLLELGFISNNIDNIIFDTKFDEIALAIAKALIENVGLKWIDTIQSDNKNESLYKVQVGAFSDKKNADNLVTRLKNAGFSAIVVSE